MRNANFCAVFVGFGPSADGVPSGISISIAASGGSLSFVRKASHRPSCLSVFAPSTSDLISCAFSISISVSRRVARAVPFAFTRIFASTAFASIF